VDNTEFVRQLPDENLRLHELARYQIFGTEPEPLFDNLAELVRLRFDTPIAIISFVGERDAHFKSHLGTEIAQAPRETTFCEETIQHEEPVIVYDATRDARYAENPFVTGEPYVQFYAGVRILTPKGAAIGAVCALDTINRSPGNSDVEFMKGIANLAMSALEMRRQGKELAALTGPLGEWRM
jgi:GAF domain-containing protein